jgi:chromosome segregation ATPase
MDPSYCEAKINELRAKITQCDQAKAGLQQVRATCEGESASFQVSKNKLSQGDVATIKQEDIFEGEMADSLKTKAADFQADMDTAGTKAEAVITALDMGMSALDGRINALNSEIAHWQNQRIMAINQLAAQQP